MKESGRLPSRQKLVAKFVDEALITTNTYELTNYRWLIMGAAKINPILPSL
jgi:hypothetical protein